MQEKETVYIVDVSGFIFRAYYSISRSFVSPSGLPVNAVYGFCVMILDLVNKMESNKIIMAGDSSGDTFRNEIYPEYKSNRSEPPEDLRPQFDLIRQAIEAFGLTFARNAKYEADDLIATYAKRAVAKGYKVVIVSSDKDLMQLVNDDVIMYDAMKKKYIQHDDVVAKFGVEPEKVIDVQAFSGDSVDNIPGCNV